MTLRIVLAEDNYLVREGVAALLELSDSMELVGLAEDYDSLLAEVARHSPDVVITDIRMPPTHTNEGIKAAIQIRSDNPDIGIVVLSQYLEPALALELFGDGSSGKAYLLKERVSDLTDIEAAVTEVAQGGSVVDPKIVDALVAARKDSMLDRLTEREAEVLAEIAKGGSNAGVAKALFVSERAIEKHIHSIFGKLDLTGAKDANRRVKAVLVYLSEGGS